MKLFKLDNDGNKVEKDLVTILEYRNSYDYGEDVCELNSKIDFVLGLVQKIILTEPEKYRELLEERLPYDCELVE